MAPEARREDSQACCPVGARGLAFASPPSPSPSPSARESKHARALLRVRSRGGDGRVGEATPAFCSALCRRWGGAEVLGRG